MLEPLENRSKPRLRGVLHQSAFSVALVVGTLLVVFADGTRASLAAAVFAGSVAAMLGTSALYHRITWSPRMRPWMRRLDHAGIYLLIAGSYTPVGLLTLTGTLRTVVLAVVWSGAGLAIAFKFLWVGAPKWLSAVVGLAYTVGAIVYALRRPDPAPRVFGYHELFHALTLVAVACQYVAIAFFVIRVG